MFRVSVTCVYLSPKIFVPYTQVFCAPQSVWTCVYPSLSACTSHSVCVSFSLSVYICVPRTHERKAHSVCVPFPLSLCIYVYLAFMRRKLTQCVYLCVPFTQRVFLSHSVYICMNLAFMRGKLTQCVHLFVPLTQCVYLSVCACTSHSVCVYLSLSLCVPVTQCVCTSHPVCVCLSLGVCVPLTQEMCTSHPDVLSPLFESHCFPMCFAWVSDVCMIHFTQKLRFLGTNLNSTHSPSYRHLVQIQIQSKQIQTDVVSTDGGDRTKNNHATAKISTNFHWSPRSFQTSFHGSPQNFKQVFTGVNRSPLIIQENCMIWRSKHLKSDLLRERDMTVSTEKWLVRVCVMCVALCWYVCVTCVWQCVNRIWRFPLEMLYPRNLPNREAQISRYTFKLNPNSNLNVWDTK